MSSGIVVVIGQFQNKGRRLMIGMELLLASFRLLLDSVGMRYSLLVSLGVWVSVRFSLLLHTLCHPSRIRLPAPSPPPFVLGLCVSNIP
jgi:hypothetical protein